MLVQARHAPALHEDPVLIVDAYHEQQADGVVHLWQVLLQLLPDGLQDRGHELVEDCRVSPEVRAEEVLRGGRVQQQAVQAAEEHLVGELLPFRLRDVGHHGGLVDLPQEEAPRAHPEGPVAAPAAPRSPQGLAKAPKPARHLHGPHQPAEDGPGLGINIDEDKLNQYSIKL